MEMGSLIERAIPEETDDNSVSDVPVATSRILMRVEKVSGEPLPESLMTAQKLNTFCVQYFWRTTF